MSATAPCGEPGRFFDDPSRSSQWHVPAAPVDEKRFGSISTAESSASPNDLAASLNALAMAIAEQNLHLARLTTTVLELVEQNGDLLQAMLPQDEKPDGDAAELSGGKGKIHRRG